MNRNHMKIQLVAYGIAKDILQSSALSFPLPSGQKISDLKVELIQQFPRFADLQSLRFAVEEEYQSDDYLLKENDEVVIIPPVSGG